MISTRHPRGTHARVLLTSVFGPYATDDSYGSRRDNPMELYHNQVTRVQGPFSLRMFHRSFVLMLLQANIEAPCTLLDFPTQEQFIEELEGAEYDIVGISGIIPNTGKVARMCELIRERLPNATIVVGGHIANQPDLSDRIDADHIVRGDGVRWMREFLGQDPEARIRHPLATSGFGTRTFGIGLNEKSGDVAGILLPSVGCPVGCNFCSTSAMFGGKGKFINFFETGDELFAVMNQMEEKLGVQSFFALDENFLLHRKRALRLLELMEEHEKSWALFVFSSARVLRSYTIDQLVALGVSWVWMGLEGQSSSYAKLSGVDTHELVAELQSHGMKVLGSTIIGLENHTPENIDAVIDYAVSHNTDFHQFMLYTPLPGTPLWREHQAAGTMLPESECDPADAHGQTRFNYRHPHIEQGEGEMLLRAFSRDFYVNGPSVMRLFETTLRGYERYRDHPNRRIAERYRREAEPLRTTYAAATWAARRWYRDVPHVRARADRLLGDLYRAFGLTTRVVATLGGPVVLQLLRREQRRLDRGWTYEPTSHRELNPAAQAVSEGRRSRSYQSDVGWVTAEIVPA